MSPCGQKASPASAPSGSTRDLIGRAMSTLLGAATQADQADFEGAVNRLRLAHDLVGRALVSARRDDDASRRDG